MPTAVCALTVGYAAMKAPAQWVIAVAMASTLLCAAGAARGSFRIVGWSIVVAFAVCVASLVEHRLVNWGEPTLMCLGLLAMTEIGHIACVIRTPEVNPSSIVLVSVDPDTAAEADAEADAGDTDATLTALLPSVALRLLASGAVSLGLTHLYLAAAASGGLRNSDAFFMMLLGAAVVGMCIYWLTRVSTQDSDSL